MRAISARRFGRKRGTRIQTPRECRPGRRGAATRAGYRPQLLRRNIIGTAANASSPIVPGSGTSASV